MKKPMDSQSDPRSQLAALFKERREFLNQSFSETPSILPELQHRLRVSAMEPSSVRHALGERLHRWIDALDIASFLGWNGSPITSFLRSGAAIAVILFAFFIGVNQIGVQSQSSAAASPSFLTLNSSPAAADRVSYPVNDLNVLPVSLDQKIDRVLAGASDLTNDATKAHYVLTSAPATYDSVVAF